MIRATTTYASQTTRTKIGKSPPPQLRTESKHLDDHIPATRPWPFQVPPWSYSAYHLQGALMHYSRVQWPAALP